MGTILFASEHVGKFDAITHHITEVSNFRRWDKTWFDHIAHEKITDPFCIFAVGLITLLRFCVFRMSEGNKTSFFKDVKDRDPRLARIFHTDFDTVVLDKPVSQLFKTIGKGREASML